MKHSSKSQWLGIASILALAATCTVPGTSSAPKHVVPVTSAPPAETAEKPIDLPGVHNVVTYAPGIISGSVPEGEEGFRSLATMGVKTIVSVDGSAPDVELARDFGLRYVHLPIGYDGISDERRLEIAKAVEALPGPVFLHCHHGKHRSAGAAAAAAVLLGRSTNDRALARMKVSGTAAGYTGLYECATTTKVASASALAAVSTNFTERVVPQGLKKAMVDIDLYNDELKAIEKAGWKVPSDHPDLVPVNVVQHLIDQFEGVAKTSDVKAKPSEFAEWLAADVKKLESLREGIASGSTDAKELGARMKSVQQSCKDCHVKYRD